VVDEPTVSSPGACRVMPGPMTCPAGTVGVLLCVYSLDPKSIWDPDSGAMLDLGGSRNDPRNVGGAVSTSQESCPARLAAARFASAPATTGSAT
jgi:hypothetical protein